MNLRPLWTDATDVLVGLSTGHLDEVWSVIGPEIGSLAQGSYDSHMLHPSWVAASSDSDANERDPTLSCTYFSWLQQGLAGSELDLVTVSDAIE